MFLKAMMIRQLLQFGYFFNYISNYFWNISTP